MANNNKLIIAAVAVAVIGGGIIAMRGLSSGDEATPAGTETAEVRNGDADSSGDSTSDAGTKTDISTAESSSNRRSDTKSGREFERGEGAAALNPTPITTSTATAVADAATTVSGADETTVTETPKEVQTQIADLVNMFKSEQDAEARVELADELGLIDSPESIKQILELLKTEQDPSVKEALLDALGGLEALEGMGAEVAAVVAEIYANTTDKDTRISAQDIMGDIGSPEAMTMLRNSHSDPQIDASLKLNAAENMLRLRASNPEMMPGDEFAALTNEVKDAFRGEGDTAYRSQALMALATSGRDNLDFFQEAVATEQDPQVKNLLERLVRIYTTLQQHESSVQPGGTPAATPPAQQ